MTLSPDRQRERLKGLMLLRVVLVTAFLGSALAVDISTFASFTEVRNVTLLVLIVLTYLLTIAYALALNRWPPARLAYVQLSGDLFVTTILTLVTGGFGSLFLFFFHLTILNAAIVSGQRGALVMAGATTACMAYFATLTMGWLPHPILDVELTTVGPLGVFYEVTINSLAGVLIAILAGHLAARLGQATEELEKKKTDILELQALNENILSSLSSGLLTVDAKGTIIFFNRAAEEITGLRSGEVLGNPLEVLFPGLADAAARNENVASPKKEPRLESTFQRPDGTEVFLGFSVSALRDSRDDEAGQIIIFQDLSEIRKLETQMKRSEKLAAIGQLSAAIAHEIRNPLASISGSVEMLSTDEHTSADNRLLMEIVVREVDRLDALIRDFLAYSQPRSLEPTPQDLVETVREVKRLFRGQADRDGVVVDLQTELTEAVVLVDPEALRQVIWNLLQNASDAVRNLPRERRCICLEIQPSRLSQTLILAVEDDGPGVSPDHREQIFQPFFTTKETGSGLGLATIFRLLEDQDSRITLEEPLRLRGARFEVHLPLSEKVQPSGQEALPEASNMASLSA